MDNETTRVELTLTEQRFGPHDPTHGTPDPMVRRLLVLQLSSGTARFEQTDYGHPGRFNPWEPRGIDPRLQQRFADLVALCDAVSTFIT